MCLQKKTYKTNLTLQQTRLTEYTEYTVEQYTVEQYAQILILHIKVQQSSIKPMPTNLPKPQYEAKCKKRFLISFTNF